MDCIILSVTLASLYARPIARRRLFRMCISPNNDDHLRKQQILYPPL